METRAVEGLRAILVCVDYADLLGLTMPYNRHHFSELMVVTSPQDKDTIALAPKLKAQLHVTESFYDNGADFNKWKGLEEALDALEADHQFLLKGDVFTEDVISKWIEYKRESEVMPINLRPVPYEFALYFDI